MKIAKDAVVSVTYNLKAGATGSTVEEIESVDETNPLVFLFGSGMMIPGFETNLDGLTKGDSFNFSIQPADAYGSVDKEAVVKLPVEIFKVEGVIDFSILKIGNLIPMSDQSGNMLQGRVLAYDEKEVTMDFNHPLAGKDLHFTGTVVGVREATPEEISHGHVHGEGGVHH
jgi:FKBP-type peptidyl-prolyl cis-trans isomerase SlyD